MPNILVYILVPIMSLLLISAQTVWAHAIKNQHLLEGSMSKVFVNLITSTKIWLGVVLYVIATGVYFLVVSKGKFFHVQILLVSVSIVLAAIIAAVLFNERISTPNIVGMVFVLAGLILVLR
jgi:uncharacterized membrane protein